jgi:hypothetical protein
MFMIGDFTIYCDESITHPPEPRVHTVGGYLSTDVQWSKFRKEWRRILEAEGLDHFHMVDFHANKPPYGSWTKAKRVDFLKSLHDIIRKRTSLSFATSVDIDGFENLTPQQQEALISPHAIAAKNCMKMVGVWAAQNIINHPVIGYIFEDGQPHKKQLRRLEDTFTDEDKWFFRMAFLNFGKKKEMNPLQSADVVAYESTKEIARKVNPLNKRGARLSGINLASDPTRNAWLYCGEFDLIQTIRDAELRAKDYAARHPDLKD